ncbi:MAG: PilZ domain-containing protein, partial [Myxococcota bacterium]
MKVRMLHPAVGEFSFPIDPGSQAVLGRRGADVEITWDRRISRRHARIWADGSRLFYEDLGSRNGSFIGSDRLNGTIELSPGMSVLLGETALVVPDRAEQINVADMDQTYEAPIVDIAMPGSAVSTQDLPQPASSIDAASPGLNRLTQDLEVPRNIGLTADMQPANTPIKSAETFVMNTQRRYPRLVSQQLATVEFSDREELRQLWAKDISKGGVFIETSNPPPTGARLEVRLQTPDGTLALHGQVVHVVDPDAAKQFNMPAGVGLQFVDLNTENRRAIQEYIDGLRAELSSDLEVADGLSDEQLNRLVDKAKSFLCAAENDELYQALGVEPKSSPASLQEQVKALQNDLGDALRCAPPPQQARLQAARGVLKRVGRLMTNEQSRLEYDFRHGYIRAKERLAAAHAGTGPSLEVLRRTWNRVSHERVDQAALLTRRAFA